MAATRQLKNLDKRLVLTGLSQGDETGLLRLALQQNNEVIFSFLWDEIGSSSDLFTLEHLNTLVSFLVSMGAGVNKIRAFLFYKSPTSFQVYKAGGIERQRLTQLLAKGGADDLAVAYFEQPGELEPALNLKQWANVFQLIGDDEVDHLNEVVQNAGGARALAHMNYLMSDAASIETMSKYSLLEYAVKCKSP